MAVHLGLAVGGGLHMDLGLAGKVAIVTGGSKGIGKAIAQELAGEGVDVAICARDRRVLEEAAKTLAAATRRRIVPIVCDTTSTKSVQDLVEATVAQLGRVDILVNNASTPGGVVTGPLAQADDELLLEDINTKVVGYMRCAKAAAPHMQRAGWGRIINIGGLSGRRAGNISGLRNAAIVHLTKTLADQGPKELRSILSIQGLRGLNGLMRRPSGGRLRMRFGGLWTRRRLRRS
jgi:NAD(P)-dependent dehydrogenase (short-subunit alcohol dehydrogenase family)